MARIVGSDRADKWLTEIFKLMVKNERMATVPKKKKPILIGDDSFEEFRQRMLLMCGQDAPEPEVKAAAPKAQTDVEIKKSIKLYYTNPSENSDKVYTLDIVREPKFKDTWYVDFSYGKRNKTLRPGRKTKIAVSYVEACRIFDSLVSEKKAEGYTENVSGRPYSK